MDKRNILPITTLAFLLFVLNIFSATTETVTIHSKSMNKDIPATVILPDAYQKGSKSFPVVYLLHGAGGNHHNWPQKTNIAELADKYKIIVFCPDGNKTSWYFDSPIDPTCKYETHVAKECVEYADKNYRTIADRDHRATCGLSMGGHGALFLAIRNLDTFSMAVALSGGVDIRPFPQKWRISKRLGTISEHPENWEKYTVINVAKVLKDGDLNIVMDCGTGDFFLKVNRTLDKQLTEANITHHYEEHPGKHNWVYWQGAIERQMPAMAQHFNK